MHRHADLRLKEAALSKVTPSDVPPGRFRPDDELWACLEGRGLCRIKQRSPRTIRRISRHSANPSRHNPGVGIMTQIVYELLIAGHETTTGLISNALRQLLTQRSAWEEICRDASLIPNAVEEVLRFDSPVIAWRRPTTQPVAIGPPPAPAPPNPPL